MNYDSYSEKEEEYNSKMVPSFNNDDILDDIDDIIKVSTYVPFNPVKEKDDLLNSNKQMKQYIIHYIG